MFHYFLILAILSVAEARVIRKTRDAEPYWKYVSQLEDTLEKTRKDLDEFKASLNDDNDEEEFLTKRDVHLIAALPNNGELFEEDMIMDDRLRTLIVHDGRKRSFQVKRHLKWEVDPETKTVNVPYTVDPNFVNGDLLKIAIREYATRTCIRFVPRTNEKGYVRFNSDKNYCSSNVGRVGARMQNVTLGNNCNVIGTVLHEMEHVLGFIHEHSRPDRDQFVSVKWKNIKKSDAINFKKYTSVVKNDVDYNFNSVMHYRNNAFTNNGEDTLVAKDQPRMRFGQRDNWSKGDVRTINEVYCLSQDMPIDYGFENQALYEGLLEDTDGKRRDHEVEEEYQYDHYNNNYINNNEQVGSIVYPMPFPWK